MMDRSKEIHRSYIINTEELKKKLGLKGHIKEINLWRGSLPERVTPDNEIEYEIKTIE